MIQGVWVANSADPSPQYIETDERASVLEMLAHVHEFSQLIVTLTGQVGSGKSTLLRHLSQQLSVHYQTLSFSASEYASLEEVQYIVALQLGCEANSQQIEQSLQVMLEQNEPFHILVDDAHLLADEAITYLMVHSHGDRRWHLLLSGDNELYDMCLLVQDNLQYESMLHHVELQPLPEEATTQFLQGFYKNAGIDQFPLSSKAVHHYWRLSDGLPGRLVSIVDTQTEVQSTPSSVGIAKLPLGHIAAVVLIGSALLVSYLYQPSTEPKPEDDAIARLIAGEAVVTEVLESAQGAENVEDASLLSNQFQASRHEEVADAADALEQQKNSVAIKPESLALEVQAKSESVSNRSPESSNESITEKKSEHPLLSANPADFGLQLVGVRKKQSAQKVVDQFGSQLGKDKLSIYSTQYKGQPWYVVVYAPIRGKDSASKAASKLSKLMSTQPWVRPMEKIQEDIRKNSSQGN